MHQRNIFKIRPPNHEELAKKYPQLRKKCFVGANGKICIDFSCTEAVRSFTEILLSEYFELNVSIPKGVLVPRVPQRLNYLLLVEDLVNLNGLSEEEIVGIDIGTGPLCIFSLLGASLNNWKFVSTDICNESLQIAKENLKNNSLESLQVFELPEYKLTIFSFSVCNPPFFDINEAEKKFASIGDVSLHNLPSRSRGQPRSGTTAIAEEIAYKFPLKEYLINNLKKIEEDVILDMAKSLIERIVKNDGVEEGTNFERLLDFTLVFMDCCAEIVNGSISTKMVESLQILYKELENLKETRICICIDGFIFASNIAMCEVSKKFDKFSINGPSIIYLNQKEVYFDVIFNQYEDQIKSNWTYEWTIKSGKECAQFSGIKTRTLKMKILKAGFINFAISISNSTFSGYRQHNLTIYDHNLLPIAKVENLNVTLPLNFVCLNAEKSINAKYFKWIPEDNLPAEMLSGSSLDNSKLFLSNLVPGVFQFNLSIWNDHSPINDTKIVKLFVSGGSRFFYFYVVLAYLQFLS
uniref:Uncharacterized protein n=1 Tax=Meloidogyne javanica TaxID=6303 RepID=A0A915M2K4_MELJA